MPFSHRLLGIYNLVRMLGHESAHGDTITEPNVLLLSNLCTTELTQRGVFKVSDGMDITASTAGYAYPADCLEVIDVFWTEDGERLTRIDTERQYQYLVASAETSTRPIGRYLTKDTIYLWPAPAASATDGVTLYYKQIQDDMTGTDEAGCTPPTPVGHDMVYVAYCLKNIFLSKRGLSKQADLYARFDQEYEREVNKLLLQGFSK